MNTFTMLSEAVSELVERAGPAVAHVRTLHQGRSRLGGGSAVVVDPGGLG
jgi:hypothetical protein